MLHRRRRPSYFVQHDGPERLVRHHDSVAGAERARERHRVPEILLFLTYVDGEAMGSCFQEKLSEIFRIIERNF